MLGENAGARLFELLDGGDFACSENQSGTLHVVARQLSELVADEHRTVLQQIARLAVADMTRASLAWFCVAARLRGQDPRPSRDPLGAAPARGAVS